MERENIIKALGSVPVMRLSILSFSSALKAGTSIGVEIMGPLLQISQNWGGGSIAGLSYDPGPKLPAFSDTPGVTSGSCQTLHT